MASFGPASRCLHPSRFDGAQRVSPYLAWVESVLELWNGPPTVDVDVETVVVTDGQVAVDRGSFADVEGDEVTLTASVGTITRDLADGRGTWVWSSFALRPGPHSPHH